MLRRHSSVKSKPDLNRRKSTSSVHGVHLEHIDHAVAERDAHAAAYQAFSRAQARERIEMPVFPPTPQTSPRRRHRTNDGTNDSDGGTPVDHTGDGTPRKLRRRESVRLVGPRPSHGLRSRASETASTRRFKAKEIIPARSHEDYNTALENDEATDHNTSQRLEVFSAPRRDPPPVPLPGIVSEDLLNLVREEKYYTPEDDVASVPSSFRRIRRSRSLFTSDDAGKKGSQVVHTASLNGRAIQGYGTRPARSTKGTAFSDNAGRHPSHDVPRLKAPRSMGFLRVRGRRSDSVTIQGTQDAEIQSTPANEQPTHKFGYLPQDGTRLAPKPSFVSSRSRRTDTRIRKSLRSEGSTNDPQTKSDDPPVAHLSSNKEERFREKARKVSRSLKTKLKSLFNLTKSEDELPSFPPQHISAQRTYVREELLPPFPPYHDHDNKSEIECSSVHRVTSGVPSLQMIPPNVLRSSRVSLESLKDGNEQRKASDDKSLTSWAGSGPSTLTSQQRMEWREELERQRLSTIRENGIHIHNPFSRRQAPGPPILRNDNAFFGNPGPPARIVDNQRLYSALMKRVDEPNKLVSMGENQRANASGVFPATDTVHSVEALLRYSMEKETEEISVQPDFQRSCSPPRPPSSARVSSKGSLGHARPTTDAGKFRTGSPSPMNRFVRDQGLEGRRRFGEGGSGRFAFNSMASSNPGVTCLDSSDYDQRFPSQTPNNNHEHRQSSSPAPQEPDSPSTQTSHLFRTKPLYRQSLRRSMEAEELLRTQQSASPLAGITTEGDSSCNTNNGASDGCLSVGADPVNDTRYSESVYSTDDRHQDGHDQESDRECPEFRRPESTTDKFHGPIHSPLAYLPISPRSNSLASSIDWKRWLSANADQFESSPIPPMPSAVEYALPDMMESFHHGHVREYAQTHDEDDDGDASAYETQTHTPVFPTSPLATVEPNVVRVSPMQRSAKRPSPSSAGKTLLENNSPHRTPPAAMKSSLRVVPSALERTRANIDYSVPSSVASSPGFTMALQRQFGAGPKY